MIVARVCDNAGNPIVASGSCRIDKYDGRNDGWFPVESFGFGFHGPQDNKAPNAQPGKPAPAKPSGSANAPPTAAGQGGTDQKPELHLTKAVDTATCCLMTRAMSERKHKKGIGPNQETPLTTDIHVVSSVSLEQMQSDRFHYTSLMIHLEAVNVQNWDISASGDARPTETVVLRFDRAAMIYVATGDGKVFHLIGPYGWDQTANKDWTWDPGRLTKYFPPAYIKD